MASSSGSKTSIVLIVVAILGVVVLLGGSVLAALAIYGVNRYVTTAKTAEARMTVFHLGRGVAECYEKKGTLPLSTPAVPAMPPRGTKYQSAPSDWLPYACMNFQMVAPQYYQYRWVRTSDTAGHVIARGDLDGDGVLSTFKLPGTVSGGTLELATRVEETNPDE